MRNKVLLFFSLFIFGFLRISAQLVDDNELAGREWAEILNETKVSSQASDFEFNRFIKFNQHFIDSARCSLLRLAKAGKINEKNIESYAKEEKNRLLALFYKFIEIKKEFPSSVEQYQRTVHSAADTCFPSCTNIGFENGDFTGWSGFYGVNSSSTTSFNITGVTGGLLGAVSSGATDPLTGNTNQVHITSSANNDWFLSNYHAINMPQVSASGGNYAAMIGDSINNGAGVAILSQKYLVSPNNTNLTYQYSVFLENPNHNYYQQPFFRVAVLDSNGDTIPNCGKYVVVSGPGIQGFVGEYYPPNNDTIYWRNWTSVIVPLSAYIGQCITLVFEVADCELGAHCGYAYVDAACTTLQITSSSPLICNGDSVTLAGPAGSAEYKWTGPPNSINGSDSAQNITVDSAGTYTLVLTPLIGATCEDTLTFTLTKSTLSALSTTAVNVSCNGGSNGSATVNAGGGIPPYTYLWNPGGGSTATITGLSAGNYTVTISDSIGCNRTDSVTITQPTLLTSAIASVVNVTCNGLSNGSATSSEAGGSSPYTYVWSPGGGTSSNDTALAAGLYTLTVTDSNGCTATALATITQPMPLAATINPFASILCFGDSNGTATVNASGGTSPYTYSWLSNGDTSSSVTNLRAGLNSVIITDSNGCTFPDSVIIPSPAKLRAAATSNVSTVCTGQPAILTASATGGISPYTYSWNTGAMTDTTTVNPLVLTIYTVYITDINGCSDSSEVTIAANTPLSLVVQPPAPICPGKPAKITAVASGGDGVYTYSWAPGNLTNQTISVYPNVTTVYTIELTDDCGSVPAIDSVTVVVNPMPSPNFTGYTTVGCAPLCVNFNDLSYISSGSFTQWSWNFGDSNYSRQENPSHCYPYPGVYTVSMMVVSNKGCAATLVIPNFINVLSNPHAAFTWSPQPAIILAPTITFTDQSTDSLPITSWLWNFGVTTDTNDISYAENPQFFYNDTGTYVVSLKVTSVDGCPDSVQHDVTISPIFALYFPNAFTPNGNGRNDVFLPKGDYVKNFEMHIYDRWGMEIFYTYDITKGWDGTVMGSGPICQEDTYVYVATATDSQDNHHNYKGVVVLMK